MGTINRTARWVFIAILTLCVAALLSPSGLADTDGTELKITDQADKLVLELGSDWAGIEFELTTDAGVFPVPVVVNELGVLSMELGGSKTYTLSRVSAAPEPEPIEEGGQESASESASEAVTPDGEKDGGGIPAMQLLVFFGGLCIAVGALAVMYFAKRRADYYAYDDDDYSEDEQ